MSRCWVGRGQFWEHCRVFGDWEAEGWVVWEQAAWHWAISLFHFAIWPHHRGVPTSLAGGCVCGSGHTSLEQANAEAFLFLFFFNPHAVPTSCLPTARSYFFRWSPWVPNWKLAVLGGSEDSCLRVNDPTSSCHSGMSLDKPLNRSLPQVSPFVKWESTQK